MHQRGILGSTWWSGRWRNTLQIRAEIVNGVWETSGRISLEEEQIGMPTLEILQLKLKSNIEPNDRELLSTLSAVRSFVKTGSHFYTSIEDSSLIYILGQWPSLQDHKKFLSSPGKEKVLKPQEELTDFQWCIHLEMGENEGMNDVLPMEAPILALARFFIGRDDPNVAGFTDLAIRYRDDIVEGTAGYKAFGGWRCDSKAGEREYLMLSGWDSKNHHEDWRASRREGSVEHASVRDHYDGLEVVHLKDIEILHS